MLAVPNIDSLSVWHASVHLDVPSQKAEDLLESLVDAFLLESAGPDRYYFHDLTRVFALEVAYASEPAEALAAGARRTLAAYADVLAQAVAVARPATSTRPRPRRHPASTAPTQR